METPLFIDNGEYNIFSILHYPKVKHSSSFKVGIVICSALAEEKLWSHRLLVNFSRILSNLGYFVLRFDYYGHGDSDGFFEDSNVKTRLADISIAVDSLKERTGVDKIGLLGVRFGGTLATLAASENNKVNFVALWEPIINGQVYMKKYLRSNIATQMRLFGKILKNRETLVEDLLKGEAVNIDGYMFSSEFYKQISEIDLIENKLRLNKPTQLITIKAGKNVMISKEIKSFYDILFSQNMKLNLKVIDEKKFWGESKFYFQTSDILFNETINWMKTIITGDFLLKNE